jgi:glucosylglycerate synthase
VEAGSIPQQAEQTAEDQGSADLVVGILAELDSAATSRIRDALASLPGPLRIAMLQGDQHGSAPAPDAKTTTECASVFFVPSLLAKPDASKGTLSTSEAYQSVFAAAEKLQARGCCVIASKLEGATPERVCQMARPLFNDEADLVLPHYTSRKFEGLLNASVIAPVMRALYGRRINNPMGPDIGVSRPLLQKMLVKRAGSAGGPTVHPLACLAPAAFCDRLRIVEVHLGTRAYPPTDWTNMSSVLADVLSPVFSDMERNASCWQRTHVSAPVRAVGVPVPLDQDAGAVDTGRLVESFQLGNRELQEIWSLVLPPSSLFELRKLSRLPAEQFRMPDELWVKVVYDFALAHRLRTISRDHLLRSLTPVYLGWVASYAQDLQSVGAMSPQRRLDRLSLAYEAGKSYLLSRWRWPDRFNP